MALLPSAVSRLRCTLPLLALLGLASLVVVGASSCRIAEPWSTPSGVKSDFLFLDFAPPRNSSLPCLALASTTVDTDPLWRLTAFDVSTGKEAWSWPLPYERLGGPITGSPYDSLFWTSEGTYDGCIDGPGRYNVTRLATHGGTRVEAVWSTSLNCTTQYGAGYAMSFAGSAKRAEQVLVVSVSLWTVLDGASGAIVLQQAPPSDWDLDDIAILGDSADHRFVLREIDPITGGGTFVTYELRADGNWTQLASATYDRFNYWPLYVESGPSEPRRSEVVVMQYWHIPGQDVLYGLDLRTGKTAWNVSGYPLLTGAWVDAHKGYTFVASSVDWHPVRADWALITSQARNADGYVIFQYGLLDSATGKLVATSAVSEPAYYGHNYGYGEPWQAVQHGEVVVQQTYNATRSWWTALNAKTLAPVSSGLLPERDFSEGIAHVFVDARPGDVSVVTADSSGVRGHGVPASRNAARATAAPGRRASPGRTRLSRTSRRGSVHKAQADRALAA